MFLENKSTITNIMLKHKAKKGNETQSIKLNGKIRFVDKTRRKVETNPAQYPLRDFSFHLNRKIGMLLPNILANASLTVLIEETKKNRAGETKRKGNHEIIKIPADE